MKTKQLFIMGLIVAVTAVLIAGSAFAEVSKEVLESIMTPDTVKTSIGTLKFLDGAPYPETAEKVYDYIDTARAADAFLDRYSGVVADMMVRPGEGVEDGGLAGVGVTGKGHDDGIILGLSHLHQLGRRLLGSQMGSTMTR